MIKIDQSAEFRPAKAAPSSSRARRAGCLGSNKSIRILSGSLGLQMRSCNAYQGLPDWYNLQSLPKSDITWYDI